MNMIINKYAKSVSVNFCYSVRSFFPPLSQLYYIYRPLQDYALQTTLHIIWHALKKYKTLSIVL
jgi:ABC-type arginine/histidine transport system permease subunit